MAKEIGALRDELTRATASIADLQRRLSRHEAGQVDQEEPDDLRNGPVADLDARDDELTALVDAARHGGDLMARRLSDGERSHLATLTESWSTWERTRLARRMRAMMLSRKLADGPIDDPARHVDAEAFRAVARELTGLDEGRERTRAAAEDAARRLADDEALRRDSDADMVAGEAADRRIRAIARERVGDAVARGDLMPPWFESVVPPSPAGATPPGDDPRWLQVASSLVAYRILYGVDDPSSALGPEPAGDWPRARRDERLGLQRLVLSVSSAGTRPPAR